MKTPITIALGIALTFTSACVTGPDGKRYITAQGLSAIATAETIANVAATAAATVYGGPMAGQFASAGLSAIASVANGYIGQPMPQSVIVATPGNEAVGQAVANLIGTKPVTPATVNKLNQAADIAAMLSVPKAPAP